MDLLRNLHKANLAEEARVQENEEAERKNIARLRELGVEIDPAGNSIWIKLTGEKWTAIPEGLPRRCYNLWIIDTHISSLKGCPITVTNTVVIRGNSKLASLEHAPDAGDGSYLVHENKLTSLVGAPKAIHGDFACHFNDLETLEGAPETVGGMVRIFGNKRLTSLHGVGTKCFRAVGSLNVSSANAQSHALGLLLVNGKVDIHHTQHLLPRDALKPHFKALQIIDRYIQSGKGRESIIDCQHELIEAGYEEMAQL